MSNNTEKIQNGLNILLCQSKFYESMLETIMDVMGKQRVRANLLPGEWRMEEPAYGSKSSGDPAPASILFPKE